ncbi:MAG: methylated-DNA--[protein]-cysteine S-methyltransferase [Bacteroidia bacterium]
MLPALNFRKEVWKTLLKIPFGKTISYEQQSRAMNNPLAIRAIAHANGANPMSRNNSLPSCNRKRR